MKHKWGGGCIPCSQRSRLLLLCCEANWNLGPHTLHRWKETGRRCGHFYPQTMGSKLIIALANGRAGWVYGLLMWSPSGAHGHWWWAAVSATFIICHIFAAQSSHICSRSMYTSQAGCTGTERSFWGQTARVWILVLLRTSCVTLGRLLTLSAIHMLKTRR